MAMHTKSDSEVTSIEASTPPRSPRRPLYYVQSPSHSQQDLEKMSFRSTPFASPTHHHFHYHCSPIHHSRESSTSRYGASSNNHLKNNNNNSKWLRMQQRKYNEVGDDVDEEEDDDVDGGGESGKVMKFYVVCFLLAFVVIFTAFCFIIWGASLSYKPNIIVKSILFENFNVQAGMDSTGVPTDMLTINSTVRIFYRNPATFFGVHVTSNPLQLHFFDLQVASGQMEKFYQSRKSQRIVTALVHGHQVPLYGGIPLINVAEGHIESLSVPLNLTFAIRSRAYVLGRLVMPTFYRSFICQVTLRGNHHGKPLNLTKADSCVHR